MRHKWERQQITSSAFAGDDVVTWKAVWRIRQRGLVPRFRHGLTYEDPVLEQMCRDWCRLQDAQDKIDKMFKEMHDALTKGEKK